MIRSFSVCMIVVDASALLDAFIRETRVFGAVAPGHLHAPVTLDAEVVHALRGMWVARTITHAEAEAILRGVHETPIMRHPVQPLIPRMSALRQNLTSYDAAYVALAESLNMPLRTRDRRLAQSCGH